MSSSQPANSRAGADPVADGPADRIGASSSATASRSAMRGSATAPSRRRPRSSPRSHSAGSTGPIAPSSPWHDSPLRAPPPPDGASTIGARSAKPSSRAMLGAIWKSAALSSGPSSTPAAIHASTSPRRSSSSGDVLLGGLVGRAVRGARQADDERARQMLGRSHERAGVAIHGCETWRGRAAPRKGRAGARRPAGPRPSAPLRRPRGAARDRPETAPARARARRARARSSAIPARAGRRSSAPARASSQSPVPAG